MLHIAAFLLGMAMMAYLQVLYLVRRKMWGELWAFAGLWVIAAAYGTLALANVALPSPEVLIIEFFEGMAKRLAG